MTPISSYQNELLLNQAYSMSSLKYLSKDNLGIGNPHSLTLPLDLYNRYWSTTHTCVEQFSHHHAYAPCPPVFTSLAELYTLHFCFRDLIHNIYIYSCNCRCLLTASKQFFRDRPFNLKGGRGLWFFVSFRIFFSDNTRVRIFIFFVAQSAHFFSRI